MYVNVSQVKCGQNKPQPVDKFDVHSNNAKVICLKTV